MHKGSRRLALMTVAMGLFAACGAGAATTTVTFGLPWGAGSQYAKGVEQAAAAFEAQHPEIKIELVAGYNHDKFATASAGQSATDIVVEGAQWIIPDAVTGFLKPLDGYVKASGTTLSDFVPPDLALAQWQGQTYAMPWASDINFAFFRNDDLLVDAGVSPDTPIELISQVDAIARKTTRLDAAGQVITIPFLPWQAGEPGNGLLTSALAFGGEFYDPASGRFTTTDPQNVAALEWMVDYAKRYRGLGIWSAISKYTQLLGDGKLVFGYVWPAQALQVRANNPDLHFSLGPIPHAEGSGIVNPVWVAGPELSISASAAHPDEAWAFIRYLTQDPDGTTQVAQVANTFPANLRSPYIRTLQADPVMNAFFVQASAAKFSRPPVPDQRFWVQTVNKATNDALALKVTPKEALETADQLVNADLKETLARLQG